MPFQEMISPVEADEKMRSALQGYGIVTVPISACAGRILRSPIAADRAQPPFDRVAMDGIALSSEDYRAGIRKFKIAGLQKAGERRKKLPAGSEFPADLDQAGEKMGHALEAMTGAVLPEGADCIVPVEEISISEGYATVLAFDNKGKATKTPKPFGNIHRAGSDCAAGDIIVPTGTLLRSPHLGAAAAFGFPYLDVAEVPKVTIVATGDELVDPDQQPESHQIRRSNPYAIEAALKKMGISQISLYHVRDEREPLKDFLSQVLETCEVLILSGGVSMGKTDFVPGVLAELGVQPIFHKIKHKPGKPFWFGLGPKAVPVFALPGNPASVLVCLHRYVIPALYRAMGGKESPCETVELAQGTQAPGTLTQFRPITLATGSDGRLQANWVSNQGSGDFSGWARSDGFVELPPGEGSVPAGLRVKLFRF